MKNMLPTDLEAIFLDFDGVVVESADIKTQAFYESYLPYGIDIAEQAKQYHQNNQGINRSVKFKEIHKSYLGIDCNSDTLDALSAKFSEIVLTQILTCPLVDGVQDFLESQQAKKIPVFLLSATPHDELLLICKVRNLTNFFTGIFGAPHSKKNVGKNLLKEHNFCPDNVVFIGDSISDYNAALSIGVIFIGRIIERHGSPFPNSISTIFNFIDLL